MDDARYIGLDVHQATISVAALTGDAIGYSNEPKQAMGHSILKSLEFPIKETGIEKTFRISRGFVGAVRGESTGPVFDRSTAAHDPHVGPIESS
jgi:hypothetical protein